MTLYVHNKCSVPSCQHRPMGWPAQDESFCEEHKLQATVVCVDGVERTSAEAAAWNASRGEGSMLEERKP